MASPSPQTYDGDPIVEQGLSKDVHKQKLVHVDLLKNRDNRHLKPLFVRGAEDGWRTTDSPDPRRR